MPILEKLEKAINNINVDETDYDNSVINVSLSPEIITQICSLLSQGYKIGTTGKSTLTYRTFSSGANRILANLKTCL